MEHVSSVRPTGKFPGKVENLKRWARFPGWNFWMECRVPFTFFVVCTSSRSTVGHRDVPGFKAKWGKGPFLHVDNHGKFRRTAFFKDTCTLFGCCWSSKKKNKYSLISDVWISTLKSITPGCGCECTSADHSYWRWLVMKPGKHQRSKQRCQNLC